MTLKNSFRLYAQMSVLTQLTLKVKVKLSLCLINTALRHEGVWGRGCIDPHFLDRGTSWSTVSRSCRFTPGERAAGTHWIGSWVDPRDCLDDLEKIIDPTGTRNPTPHSSSP
jgi:hypothetical protein